MRWFTDWHGTELRDEGLMPFPRTPAGVRDVRSRYFGAITHMDFEIGRILDQLDAARLTENTLVLFCADQGISLGDRDGVSILEIQGLLCRNSGNDEWQIAVT